MLSIINYVVYPTYDTQKILREYYLIQLEQKAYLTITHKTEIFFHIDSIELTEYTNILCM